MFTTRKSEFERKVAESNRDPARSRVYKTRPGEPACHLPISADGEVFDSPLDPGIYAAVEALRKAGIATFESCQGGQGHAYPEPTVRFHGGSEEGLRALSVAIESGLPVIDLRKVWPVIDNEPTGPWWELTFLPMADQSNRYERA